jgi:hypothetical protein
MASDTKFKSRSTYDQGEVAQAYSVEDVKTNAELGSRRQGE